MHQRDESPLFCRKDTPPRSGVPPGYVSMRPLILQRQRSLSSHQHQHSTELEDEAPQHTSQTDVSPTENQSSSAALVDLNSHLRADAIDAVSVGSEGEYAQYQVQDQSASQRGDEEEADACNERSTLDDSVFEPVDVPAETWARTVENFQPQHGTVGSESSLFCREDTPPRSGVPPGYEAPKSAMGRRACERRTPVAWPRIVHGSAAMFEEPQKTPSRLELSNSLASESHQPAPTSTPALPVFQPPTAQPNAQQQRPILPYVFAPSFVPQTPMESTMADPLVTKGEARSGTAVYLKHSPVTTTTSEGLYTLTDGQVYWNSRGRRQCFKLGCDNNHGIGYTSEQSRDEHISNTRLQREVPHLGFEQTKRGYRKSHGQPT